MSASGLQGKYARRFKTTAQGRSTELHHEVFGIDCAKNPPFEPIPGTYYDPAKRGLALYMSASCLQGKYKRRFKPTAQGRSTELHHEVFGIDCAKNPGL
jgi:hypothetical protein